LQAARWVRLVGTGQGLSSGAASRAVGTFPRQVASYWRETESVLSAHALRAVSMVRI